MRTVCKKCLLEVQAESYSAMIEKCMAAIPPRDRVTEEAFAQRVAVCQACDYFLAATCRACGCYVELRAMKTATHCPYKKW